ncbi:hypothetical protein [Seohaeicola sp.]|uniref:hypothetical protein n=1 Tax=Seohaeicola sp. TaxID=2042026 RepID=UPI003A8C7048
MMLHPNQELEPPANPARFRDACEAWLKECQRNNLERATIRSYRGHVEHHIDKKIGVLLVADLTRGDIAGFMDDLQDEGLSRAMTRKVLEVCVLLSTRPCNWTGSTGTLRVT